MPALLVVDNNSGDESGGMRENTVAAQRFRDGACVSGKGSLTRTAAWITLEPLEGRTINVNVAEIVSKCASTWEAHLGKTF